MGLPLRVAEALLSLGWGMGLPLTQSTSLHLSLAPQICCCSRNRRRTLAVSMRSGRSWARECVSVHVMCVSDCVSVWGGWVAWDGEGLLFCFS